MTFKKFAEVYGIRFCKKHHGKMKSMWSLSTSVRLNPICQKRAKDEKSICSKCYADRMLDVYEALENVLANNTRALTTTIIPVEDWPSIKKDVFRFEAFGDISNTTQVLNYFNCCLANPQTTFALWTKNPSIIARALISADKPKNLIIIYSCRNINEIDIPPYSFIDKYFIVYDKEHAKEHDINCGARDCNVCRRCYSKSTDIYIKEIVK